MGVRSRVVNWYVYRRLTGADPLARGAAASRETQRVRARTGTADRVGKPVCPYCAVGCGQDVYVKDGKAVRIEGNPDSPVSRGRLCLKGSATLQPTTGDARHHQVLHRPPHARDGQPVNLDTAVHTVAERMIRTRRETWEGETDGVRTARTLGIASLGGAALDDEENHLIKKLLTGLGVVQVENRARVRHSSTVAGLGTSFGRGGATTLMQEFQHSDCIVIEGSDYAEAHPVGFQWVMEAKARGARVIHVDPRYTRTSALADPYVPIRAGSDIAFLGGIIDHVRTEEKAAVSGRSWPVPPTRPTAPCSMSPGTIRSRARTRSRPPSPSSRRTTAADRTAACSARSPLADDGSTSCGCWIYCGVHAEGATRRPAASRTPSRTGWPPEWAWAWPAHRRVLCYRAPAAPDGTRWSERKAYVWWDADAEKCTGHDVPDFIPGPRPGPRTARGRDRPRHAAW